MFNCNEMNGNNIGKAKKTKYTLLLLTLTLLQLSCNEAFPICLNNLRLKKVSLSVSMKEHLEIADETYRANLQIAEFANKSSRRNFAPAMEAIHLLRSLEHPDTVGYNSVLKALSRTSSPYNKDAVIQAVVLLEEMESLNREQSDSKDEWYIRLSENSLDDEEVSMGAPRVRIKPNCRTYSTVMDVFARQNNPSSAERAHELLEKLKDKYEETGDIAYLPSTITYNTVINGWAKAGAGERGAFICENLLSEMGDLADVISFNNVLHAWARSDVPDAGERAERILRSMNTVRPNSRTYNTVIHAWSRSTADDATRHAHSLLREMDELAKDEPSMSPDFFSYSSVINALALAKSEPLKAHSSFLLIQRMNKLAKENQRLRPNLIVYNTALNACATSCPIQVQNKVEEDGRGERLPSLPLIVRTLYDQLTQDIHLTPDHVTYGTVLKAIANLFLDEPDQVDFGKRVFRSACASGQVSVGVVHQLRQAVPSYVFRELVPEACISSDETIVNKFPEQWVCNLRESTRQRKIRSDGVK
ncbi:unnamed protein product [Cylindrotheca closterium]|uniref:Uncharacterized protein n=1 Tax=Cylindrotheca closterium TaxID=2856 RepID=A0AAD2FWT4_9STRA|nr:unnamed protein product [Cylindrotheca closterium]